MSTRRKTNKQQRMEQFVELVYRTLRAYQNGALNKTSGVAAGLLDVPLTTVLDRIKEHARKVFERDA